MKKVLLVATMLLCSSFVMANSHNNHDHHNNHANHGQKDKNKIFEEKVSGSTKSFKKINDNMHSEMNIDFTGDADIDFVRGMIPHHQGAIDMANVVLKYGKSEKIRDLAKNIIREQEKEIELMEKWLKENDR